MIPFLEIRQFFQDCQDEIGVDFYAANWTNGQTRPTYPFATYLKMTDVQRDRLQQVKSYEAAASDKTKITTHKQSHAVVSVNFMTDDPTRPDYTAAQSFLDYIEGSYWDDLVVYPQDTTLQDRTAYMEPVVEYRCGVDIDLYYTHAYEELTEQLNTVSIDNQILAYVTIASGDTAAEIEAEVHPFLIDGQTITGDGIPDSTTLTKGTSPNITLSNAATASGDVITTIQNYEEELTP